MTHKAGERLFEAIGGIPEEMILEAEQDALLENMDETSELTGRYGNGEAEASEMAGRKENGEAETFEMSKLYGNREAQIFKMAGKQKNDETTQSELAGLQENNRTDRGGKERKSSGLFKYLPIAACLCLVFGGAYYAVSNLARAGRSADSSMSWEESAFDSTALESAEESGGAESGMDSGTNSDQKNTGTAESSQQPELKKPMRFDAYEGPVMAMTATGDTQKLKTNRTVKGTVISESQSKERIPLLCIEDQYQIKNRAQEDKTLQLVYPFASTLNLAYDLKDRFMEISGQDDVEVSYNVGESIRSYWNKEPGWTASVQDYWNLFEDGEEYQERALEKEADWNREVWVYTFSADGTQDESLWNEAGVIGITINGADADVLTYGFDYSSQRTQETADYCFFAGERDRQRYLIITGEAEESPKIGYYTNLDCVDEMERESMPYHMQEERMSYADALRMCSRAAAKQLSQDYAQGVYHGEFPEYMDGGTVYQALTVISEEEKFYDTLIQQYKSTEFQDIFEKIFGETRIIYALTTVTIPAGKSIRVTVRTQKRQISQYYTLQADRIQESDRQPGQGQADQKAGVPDRYDILPGSGSHLNIRKTVCRISLSDEWQLSDQNMKLQHKNSVWSTVLYEKLYHFAVK